MTSDLFEYLVSPGAMATVRRVVRHAERGNAAALTTRDALFAHMARCADDAEEVANIYARELHVPRWRVHTWIAAGLDATEKGDLDRWAEGRLTL